METQQQHDVNDFAEQRLAELVREAWDEVQRRNAKVMDNHFERIRAVVAGCVAGSWRDTVSERATKAEAVIPIRRSRLRLVCKEWETGNS